MTDSLVGNSAVCEAILPASSVRACSSPCCSGLVSFWSLYFHMFVLNSSVKVDKVLFSPVKCNWFSLPPRPIFAIRIAIYVFTPEQDVSDMPSVTETCLAFLILHCLKLQLLGREQRMWLQERESGDRCDLFCLWFPWWALLKPVWKCLQPDHKRVAGQKENFRFSQMWICECSVHLPAKNPPLLNCCVSIWPLQQRRVCLYWTVPNH